MESEYHIIDELRFVPSTLTFQLTSLHTGEPDGLIGLPLTVTEKSSRYFVSFEHVGRFHVVSEAFYQLKEPYQKITNFMYKMLDSEYLRMYEETARLFAFEVDPDATIEHYVVFSEFYVVDVLSAEPTAIEVLDSNRQ